MQQASFTSTPAYPLWKPWLRSRQIQTRLATSRHVDLCHVQQSFGVAAYFAAHPEHKSLCHFHLVKPRYILVAFFPSNARWLSPGRLTNRKYNCIWQIQRIRSVATSVLSTVCNQKRTDWIDTQPIVLSPCKNRKADNENKNKTKRTRTNNKQNNKKQDSTAGGQLVSS